ncbi:MAG: response regulator transcription factor [Dehalococcoidales bacterium]|jgi:DNA-binding NarL/FixJ family response regulator
MNQPQKTASTTAKEAVIGVFLVDDHQLVRQGLRTILRRAPGIEVVGEASSGEEALALVKEIKPDVILMDIRMDGTDGFKSLKQIKKVCPDTAFIMLTVYDSELYAAEAIRTGASGYITKDCTRELLINGIRVVSQGGTVWQEGILRRATRGLSGLSEEGTGGDLTPQIVEQLTPRELEILALLAEGYGNKQICTRLNLADITVKKYIKNILTKLGVSNRTHAALMAVRLGLT